MTPTDLEAFQLRSKQMTTFHAQAFTDPIGPGTPAWNQYDLAIHAWRSGRRKSYDNHRQYMIKILRNNNVDSENMHRWCDALKADRDNPDYYDSLAD